MRRRYERSAGRRASSSITPATMPEALALLRPGARPTRPRSRDPGQAGRVLPGSRPARKGARRFRPRQSAHRLGVARFRAGRDRRHQLDLAADLLVRTSTSPKAGATAASRCLMLDRNEEALDSFRTAITLWNLPQNYRDPRRAARPRTRAWARLSPAGRRSDCAQGIRPGDRDLRG